MKKTIIIITILSTLTAVLGFGYFPTFNGGELTPLIKYRVDLDKRYMGVETMENFLVKPQGAVIRRPGTLYVAETKGEAHLVSFEYSTDDAYVLEFSDSYIRFFRNE